MVLPTEFFVYVGIGLAAQLVDGALGMAYGVITASLLLASGMSPALASASLHTAEVAITGVSGLSHGFFGNVDRKILRSLVLPGVIGGVIGALLLSWVHWPWLRVLVALYLMVLGAMLLIRVWRGKRGKPSLHGIGPLALVAGFLDAVTGGGWGALTTSSLVARHHEPRFAIGTAHAAKFFVSVAISVAFFFTLGFSHAQVVLGLMTGGVIAAPFAAWVTKHVPPKVMMGLVGAIVVLLGVRNLAVGMAWIGG